MSPRTVGRIILEGGIAAKMQLVHEIMSTECKSIQELNYFTSLTRNVISAITLSGDGTNKHVTHESKHITLQTVDGTTPATQFGGINTAANHTSKTQFDGWMDMINDAIGLYKDSPMGKRAKISLQDFASKIKGVSTDHVEDQKKLVRLI